MAIYLASDDHDDPLAAPRGIINALGATVAAVLWFVVLYLVFAL